MTDISKIAVLGGGAWGTTVASLLASRSTTVLWALEDEVASEVNRRHRNTPYLSGASLHADLTATTDLRSALDQANAVFMAVPSAHYRRVLERAAAAIPTTTPFVSLTKGIERGTLLRMTEVASDVLVGHDPDRIGVLSGPNVARDVIAGHPAATVLAMPDAVEAVRLQRAVMGPTLRVYTNADVVGCELGGSLKNVVALAAGMAAGLGFGENTIAALVTRGLAELTRLGVSLGADPLTFLGLAGVGDLVATCHSDGSRNRTVGLALGQGRSLADVLAGMRAVAEGVQSSPSVLELGHQVGVDLPICEQVHEVLEGRTSPADAVEQLLQRDAKAELAGILAVPTG